MGDIETKTSMSPRARSRSVLQAKLLALDIKALPKDANVDVLIDNVPKGERNQNPTKKQYSIQCPSFVYPVARRHSVLRRSGETSTP